MSALSRLLREIVTRLVAFRQAAGRLLGATLGTVSWQPPGWLTRAVARLSAAGSRFAAEPVRVLRRLAVGAGKVVLVLVALLAAIYVWASRPSPSYVGYAVTAPGATDLTVDNPRPQPLRVVFEASVAAIAVADREIRTGVAMSPSLEGTWRWVGDRELRFDPASDWPVGQEFQVTMAKETLLAPGVRLEDEKLTFSTAPFKATLASAEFYQDPVRQDLKRVVVRLSFTHPVDTASLAKRVSLRLQGSATGIIKVGKSVRFTVATDKRRLQATVLSDPLPIPPRDAEMRVVVSDGIRSIRPGPGTTGGEREQSVRVPGLYSLAVTGAQLTLVRNDRYEPEQVMVLDLSADVNEQEMRKRVHAWVLPVYHPDTKPEDRKRPWPWHDATKIGPEILRLADTLHLEPIPGERENVSTHSFRYTADPGRFLLIRIDRGLTSFGGYVLGRGNERTALIPPFPKEIQILGTGALLSLGGERKISIYSRDVPALQVEIGRVLPDQVQHLVSQTGVLFGRTSWNNYNFDDRNVTERFTEVHPQPETGPGKPHYQPVDLGRYLSAGQGPRGLFLVTARAWDSLSKTARPPEDRRLILVTDLGLIAKRGADGVQDLFVQSLRTGDPVPGATVNAVGMNGLTILSTQTDEQGHARLPSLVSFKREQAPLLYTARRGDDVAFLSIDRHDRQLDLSRFDVGGVVSGIQADRLTAYLFSDRGVYRPGDEFRVGVIVKPADWSTPLAGIPLEAVITDARGLEVRRDRIRLSAQGFEEIRHSTAEASPTGTWTVNLYIVKDGAANALLGSTTVQVREFLPDRMKMTARLSTESPAGWVSPEELRATVSLQNLFGTPAAGRRITASVELTPGFPALRGFEGYRFFDPQRAKDTYSEQLPDATTDQGGGAEFALGLERYAKATYRLRVIAEGYEADGGRSVTAEAGGLVSSLPWMIGWKADGDLRYLHRDAARQVELVAVGPSGRRLAAGHLTLVRVRRTWVSVLTRDYGGTYKYTSVLREAVLDERRLAIPAAGTTVTLATDQPGDYSLVVRDPAGTDLNRLDYTVAGSANLARSLERNAELELTLDRSDYAPGETIELQIRAPYTGSGLITIERDRVYEWRWFTATTATSTQRITLPAGVEGNGYVSVSFVRDVNSDEIFTSPLSHGVAPFSVSLDRRRTGITLDAPDLVKPGTPFRVGYRTDRPARIVVFAVDEGILQVAGYHTPDPLGFFFQKRALEVRTSQMLDLILPEFQRLMALAAPGGDQEGLLGRNLNPFRRRRDQPVAFWSGIREADAGGGAFSFTVPDYFNGTLRVMAVAVAGGSVGSAERKALVRGDFVLSPNVPLMVAPGDTFEVSLGVANNVPGSGKGAKVAVELTAPPGLTVLGPAATTLPIDEMREASTVFRMVAGTRLGSADLAFGARLGARSGRLAAAISVRPAVPYRTTLAAGAVQQGSAAAAVDRDLHREFRTVEAGMSVLPLGLAHGLVRYLEKFPYGCTEQLVSQGVPAMVLRRRPEFGIVGADAERTFNAVLAMLRSRQNEDGAFGLWAANTDVDDFVSAYAWHFLLEARERGHAVPPAVLARGVSYLQAIGAAEGGSLAEERTRAYAIYLLTRQGIVTTPLIAAVRDHAEAAYPKEWKQDLTGAFLAASYQLLRQERAAGDLIAASKFGASRPADYGHYDDGLSHDAMLLYLISRHFPAQLESLRATAIPSLVAPVQQGLYNTLSSAWTVLALDAYTDAVGTAPAARFTVTETLADGTVQPLPLPSVLFPRAAVSPRAKKVSFESDAEVAAFYLLSQAGFDRAIPRKPESRGLEVFREYTDRDGKPVTSVKLGDELDVHLRFRVPGGGTVPSVALMDLLPGGFEVVENGRRAAEPRALSPPSAEEDEHEGEDGGEYEGEGDGEALEKQEVAAEGGQVSGAGWRRPRATWVPAFGEATGNWRPAWAEVREDRVNVYVVAGADIQEFVYRVKATAVGSFMVPPAYGESMYDRAVRAWTAPGRIVVKRP